MIGAMSDETYMLKLLKSMTDEHGKPRSIKWLSEQIGRAYKDVHPDVVYGFKPGTQLDTFERYAAVLEVSPGTLVDKQERRK